MGTETPPPDPALLAAYRAAEYVTPVGGRVCRFQVDRPTPAPLGAWLDAEGPAGWLSAFNPGSRPLPILENLERHQALWDRLQDEGLTASAGYAADPAGVWPDETSLLVFAIGLARLNRLALEFGQLAFLWLEPGEPARLWLTGPSGGRPAPADPGPGGPGTGVPGAGAPAPRAPAAGGSGRS
ncbi:MAG: DUF3293 domain-containing protein [Thioalkalivibrio sp.]|nr:MAG: DUF3293 domain-containing protein [Thioalkalivibrio sp.]